jgi:hypothetical protein
MLASLPSTELESDIARFGNPDSVTKHQALATALLQSKNRYRLIEVSQNP